MKENTERERRRGFFGKKKNVHENSPPKRIILPTYPCSICSEEIQEISTALAYGTDQNPTHFDCVLKEINRSETLSSGESIIYIGSGIFAVVSHEKAENSPFKIHRRIVIESKENVPQWKKEIKTIIKAMSKI